MKHSIARIQATRLLAVLAVLTGLAACEAASEGSASVSGGNALHLDVYKSPSCGCCGGWVDHLDPAEFRVAVHDLDDLAPVKAKHGIAAEYQSCHTAVADGYFFEGHVPARFVRRFLAHPPEGAVGLSVPGMPVGSPGMESGSRFTPYQVLQINSDGTATVYAEVAKREDQIDS